MDYILSEIVIDFKFGDELIGIVFVMGKILFVEGFFVSYDLFDFLGEDFVFDFFVIEEFWVFGCIVDNFRDLNIWVRYELNVWW